MNAAEISGVQEIIQQEVSSSFNRGFKYLDIMRDRLEITLTKQDQRMEDLDELVIGFSRDLKADHKKHLETIKDILSQQKIFHEETKKLYLSVQQDSRDMKNYSDMYSKRLSKQYDFLLLATLKYSFIGGVSALMVLFIIQRFVIPFLGRFL
jgi:hypothetical protein